MRRAAIVLLLAGGLAGCISNPVKLSSQLDAGEVRALFSDRTVESVNQKTGRTSFTYYRPDGRVLQQRYWSRRAGSWRVTADGRICLRFAKERCRAIEYVNGRYYKRVPHKGRLIRYRRFMPGNVLLGRGERWPRGPVFRP